MRIHFLQHVFFESPGLIGDWAQARGHAMRGSWMWAGEGLPSLAYFDMLVVMGGPMSVHDEADHSWLRPEKELIARSMAAGKSVVGICLGAQMLAQVLGARVYKSAQKEIGWFPVRVAPEAGRNSLFAGLPAEFSTFHWHGETFDVPAGALRLAESDACPVQAFETGRSLALQFHPEMTRATIEGLLRECSGELAKAPYVQSPSLIRAGIGATDQNRQILFELLDRVAVRTAPEA